MADGHAANREGEVQAHYRTNPVGVDELFQIDPIGFRGRVAFSISSPVTIEPPPPVAPSQRRLISVVIANRL